MKTVAKALAVLVAVFGLAGPAAAQMYTPPPIIKAPMPRKLPPTVMMIRPSQALNIALQAMPAAKALGVQLRGPIYIVKLKQGNSIMQVRVNAANGAIQ